MEPEDVPPLLTPEELVDYPLRKATRGYAVSEVDDLLDALAAQTDRLLDAVDGAREERDARTQQVRELQAQVRELEQATEHELAAARRVGEGIVREARGEAERIAEEGRLRAREHMDAALRRIRAEEVDLQRRQQVLVEHLATLRQFADDHRERLAQHLRHELARLDAVVVPPDPETPGLGRDPLLDEPGLAGRAAQPAADAAPGPVRAESEGSTAAPRDEDREPTSPAPWRSAWQAGSAPADEGSRDEDQPGADVRAALFPEGG